jgi:hypothetical protein
MHDVYDLTPSMMSSSDHDHASAVDIGSAKKVEEMNTISDIPKSEMAGAPERAVSYG